MAYKLVVFDLDGTLWRGDQPIPFAIEAVQKCRQRGLAVRFVSNNATLTARQLTDKLLRLGFQAQESEALTSSMALAPALKASGVSNTFVIGEPGMVTNIEAGGIRVVPNDQAEAVCIGLSRQFTYQSLDQGFQVLRRGCPFFATNTDATFPLEGGYEAPGAGSLVAALATAAGRQPVVVGKPEPALINICLEQTGATPEETLVVGDKLSTDIDCGKRVGCATFLVLTGVEKVAPPGQEFGEDLRTLPV